MTEFVLTFGQPVTPAMRRRARAHQRQQSMVLKYGTGPPDTQCRSCQHLICGGRIRFFKCALYGDSASEATDWRKKWPACGAYQPKEA